MYILSNNAIQAINAKRPAIISKLALSIRVSDQTINRLLRENTQWHGGVCNKSALDNDLTKESALQVMIAETGLTRNEILDEVGQFEAQI